MPNNTSHKALKKGFTLIELIVVIVILGLLAALAVPTFGSVLQNTKNEITYSELEAAARNTKALHLIQSKAAWEDETVVTALSESAVAAFAEGIFAADEIKQAPQRLVENEAPEAGVIGYSIDAEGDLRLVKLTTDNRAAVVTLDTISGGAQVESDKSFPAVTVNAGILDLPALAPNEPEAPEVPETPIESVVLAQPADLAFSNDATTSKGILTWSPVQDATSYEVSVNGGAPEAASSNSLEVSTTPGQELTFSVTAIAGETRSIPADHTVRIEAAIPQNLTSKLVYTSKWSPGGLTLNWDEVPGATSYNVYRGATLLSQVTTNSYTGSHNLKAASSVTVKAVTASGEGEASAPTKLAYLNTNTWTQQFTADGVTRVNPSLGLVFSASTTRSYELYRNSESTPVSANSGNAFLDYTDSTLTPSTDHTFRVVVKDGNSTTETSTTFKTPPKSPKLNVVGTPTLEFSDEVKAVVNVVWPALDSSRVTYSLYSSPDGNFASNATLVEEGLFADSEGSLNYAVYMNEGERTYYRVVGVDKDGVSSIPSAATDTVVNVLPFGSSNSPTTNLSASMNGPRAATLTWTGNVALDQVLQRKLSTSSTWETLHTVTGNPQDNTTNRYYTQDFVDQSIVVNGTTKTYEYRVVTKGASGDHTMSTSFTVK